MISKVLNHVDNTVTAIYDRHTFDAEKRQALETWGRRLDAILTGEHTNVTAITEAERRRATP